jgi:AcrR family transcriptional regulator
MTLRTRHKRVTKEPDVRRRELMDAAIRVFAEKGVTRSTVADITRSAGVAKGTFYLYFSSKEQLVGALKDRLIDEILNEATSLYSRVGQEDWNSLLEATVASMTDFFIDRQDMIQVMVQEAITPESNEMYAETVSKCEQMFAAAIRLGVESGDFHATDPDMAGRLINAALEGSLHNSLLYGGGIDRERFILAATEMVRKMLAPPSAFVDGALPTS